MKQALLILCGIPFSGKTTLAEEFERILNFQRINLDDIKFELFGNDVLDENISQDDWDKVYKEMYIKIEENLRQGYGVIHDTGNFTVYERGLINHIARRTNVPFVTIFVNTPWKIAHARLLKNRLDKKRFDVSDQDFDSTVKEMEPPTPEENPLVIDENTPATKIVDIVTSKLR